MNEPNDILLAVASQLSPAARNLLLSDSVRLRSENDRTYEFLGRERIRNPLRPTADFARKPDLKPKHFATDAEKAALEALGFFPSGVYADDVITEARWLGPDGVVFCLKVNDRRYMSAMFEDGTVISGCQPDRVAANNEGEPNIEHLPSKGDLVDDYRQALEATARHMAEHGVRPVYRFEDPELDLLAWSFYWEHQLPLAGAAMLQGMRALKWGASKIESLGKSVTDHVAEKARKTDRELERRAFAGVDGVVFHCQHCQKKTRVPFAKLGATGRCGQCKEALPTTDYPIDATTSVGLANLVRESPIPVVVDFWAAWCAPCMLSMPQLVAAAGDSDGRFVVARVSVESVPQASTDHGIEALPTMIRFENGKERNRSMGAKNQAQIVSYALGS